jgi:hypothetical protein
MRHPAFQKSQLFYNGVTQKEIESTGVLGLDGAISLMRVINLTANNSAVVVENGGIVGRGVLLDYADWAGNNSIELKPMESVPILLDHLKEIVNNHDIELRPGDILFIRSGFTAAYDNMTIEEQNALAERPSPDFAGVEANEETLRWLWHNQFAAIAGDAPSFERAPIAGPHANLDTMLHQWCLAGWGMPIGEMFDLEGLAKYCKESGRYSFFLSSVPLKVSCFVNKIKEDCGMGHY